MEPDEQSLELVVYSSRKILNEIWLANFVKQLEDDMSTLDKVRDMLNMQSNLKYV